MSSSKTYFLKPLQRPSPFIFLNSGPLEVFVCRTIVVQFSTPKLPRRRLKERVREICLLLLPLPHSPTLCAKAEAFDGLLPPGAPPSSTSHHFPSIHSILPKQSTAPRGRLAVLFPISRLARNRCLHPVSEESLDG